MNIYFIRDRLARYPRPQFIVFDNGSTGESKREFKQMCENYGIEVCVMLPRTEITCLNHVTCMFIKQDPMIQKFELCYMPV
jgi:hypothetical protein